MKTMTERQKRQATIKERISMLELERQINPLPPDQQEELERLWEELNELDLC